MIRTSMRLAWMIVVASLFIAHGSARGQIITHDSARGQIITHGSARAQACAPDPWTEIVTREDIVDLGLSRLSEVFEYSILWHSESVDGYHVEASPSGLGPAAERWTLHVDDIPISTRLFGRNHLNALPISIFDVECIELRSAAAGAGLAAGGAGSVRIYTSKPDSGLTLAGAVSAGNEINDPGPFRYTGEGGPNVDRVGPAAGAAVEVDAGTWTAKATGRLDEFHVTDAVLLARTRHLYPGSKPHIQERSIGLTGSFGPAGRTHALFGGRSSTADLAFFPDIGFEVPTRHELTALGGSGRVDAGAASFRYAASYVRGALERRSNRAEAAFGWRQDVFSAEAESAFGPLRVGGSVRAVYADADVHLAESHLLTTSLFAAGAFQVRPGWKQEAGVEYRQQANEAASAVYGRASFAPSVRHRLFVTARYGHLLPDDLSLWTWVERGYVLPLAATPPTVRRGGDLPRLAAVDAAWTARPTSDLAVGLKAFVRQISGDRAALRSIAYDPSTAGLDVHTHVDASVYGSTIGVSASVDVDAVPHLRQRFAYSLETSVQADSTYEVHRDRVPFQRLSYRATFAPVKRFSVSAVVRYTASAVWPEYVDASIPSPYTAERPQYVRVDVSASKRFWKDHVTATLALRNALDEPIRRHPAGVVEHTALHFTLRVRATSTAGF